MSVAQSVYVSHISDDGTREELVRTHLNEVADKAGEFADAFGAREWGRIAGMLHDIGKYSDAFQRRIRGEGPRVDHSTAGAYIAALKHLVEISYCIAGHHGGLPNGGVRGDFGSTLWGRIAKAKKQQIPSFDAYEHEVAIPDVINLQRPFPIEDARKGGGCKQKDAMFDIAFFTRMLFSCLVDADYLCTERFMQGEGRVLPSTLRLSDMRDMLEACLMSFYPPRSRINEVRCEVLDDCKRAAQRDPGVFSLTVPTGGGKTYALMRFALHHATQKGRAFDRVICVEPYTSIIEQNAAVYRRVFGEAAVLEHHSNYDFEDTSPLQSNSEDDTRANRLKLATENWDAPLVVTTNVQLFESLYANKTSRCRKLHNIARSVIVLDEAQMIPTQYVEPCVKALSELVRHYGCTVVLCTATQPALNALFEREGLDVYEICSRPRGLIDDLRRVTYKNLGRVEDSTLAGLLLDETQALCVVNSRRQAQVLYDMVASNTRSGAESVFHLSTLMYPVHRSRTIETMRMRLDKGLPCIVVATSLVEAGVDLDFEAVYRGLSGIDSLVQAAGRCNREMRRRPQESFVYIYEQSLEYKLPTELNQRAQVSQGVLRTMCGEGRLDIDSLETIEDYYQNLYFYRSLDDRGIVSQLACCQITGIPFERVASQFRFIEDDASTIIIPTPENEEDIDALISGRANRGTMRRLARFGVTVYGYDCKMLWNAGDIEGVCENTYLLRDDDLYKEDVGLTIRPSIGEAMFL